MKIFKKFLKNIILALAGICLAIFLAEIFVRIFYPESRDHVLPSGLYENDRYLGWKLSKEKSANHHSKFFNVNYTTNSFGFRDKKRIIQKENEKYRILLYGDSQIFGWGNPAEIRFSNLLEKSLPNVEIWNLAVPAYGLDQQILSYQRDAVDADAVIFFVSEYTVDRIKYEYVYKKYKPKFVNDHSGKLKVILPKEPTAIKSFIDNSIKWMYLPFFLEKRFYSSSLNVSIYKEKTDSNKPKMETNDLVNKLLLMARDIANHRDDTIIILCSNPYLGSKNLEDFCIQSNIGYFEINLDDKKNEFIISGEDGHWNSKANEIIFRQLLPEIKKLTSIKSNFLSQRIFYNNTIR